MPGRTMFRYILDDANLQMELIARSLNYKIKYKKWVHLTETGRVIAGRNAVKIGIEYYDQDKNSDYTQAVMQCHKCFKDGGEPYACYQEEYKKRHEKEKK